MGVVIAKRGLRIIYGAGCTGLMGALADGALQAGGEVIGVIPNHFNTPALVHQSLTDLEVVDTIHQRKSRMIEMADSFIALPGGYGTFEEDEFIRLVTINAQNAKEDVINFFKKMEDFVEENSELFLNQKQSK